MIIKAHVKVRQIRLSHELYSILFYFQKYEIAVLLVKMFFVVNLVG